MRVPSEAQVSPSCRYREVLSRWSDGGRRGRAGPVHGSWSSVRRTDDQVAQRRPPHGQRPAHAGPGAVLICRPALRRTRVARAHRASREPQPHAVDDGVGRAAPTRRGAHAPRGDPPSCRRGTPGSRRTGRDQDSPSTTPTRSRACRAGRRRWVASARRAAGRRDRRARSTRPPAGPRSGGRSCRPCTRTPTPPRSAVGIRRPARPSAPGDRRRRRRSAVRERRTAGCTGRRPRTTSCRSPAGRTRPGPAPCGRRRRPPASPCAGCRGGRHGDPRFLERGASSRRSGSPRREPTGRLRRAPLTHAVRDPRTTSMILWPGVLGWSDVRSRSSAGRTG